MRLPSVFVLPTLLVVTGLLGVGCDERDQPGTDQSTAAYEAAHPPVKGNRTAVAPPHATPAYPQASSGPGTPSVVPPTTQPVVVTFVRNELDRARQLAANGKTNDAAKVIRGIQLQRSSWSRQTQAYLDPQIAEAQKSLNLAGQSPNQ